MRYVGCTSRTKRRVYLKLRAWVRFAADEQMAVISWDIIIVEPAQGTSASPRDGKRIIV